MTTFASQLFNTLLTPEEKSVAGGEQVGMIRTMADFAKAAYHLEPSEDKVINDVSPNADAAAIGLTTQGWIGLNLHPILSPISVVTGQTVTNGMFDDGFYINGNAAACVERCGDAIVLSFRGTNDNSKDGAFNPNDPNNSIHPDVDQWSNMVSHYELFNPLIAAFDAYVAANGISKVYVTGHSMGGAVALEYMSSHLGSQYQAVTFGAPPFTQLSNVGLTERKNYSPDSRITQIEIVKDPVPLAFDIKNPLGNTTARPARHIIDFAGIQTLDTPDRITGAFGVIDYQARTANHSMDYYRQITNSVDADSWAKILAGTGTQTVLLGGQQVSGTSDFIVDGQLSGTNVSASNGDDQLASIDSNVIYGGKGNDTLMAGVNNTLLLGGTGSDTAIFKGTQASASINYSSSSNTFTVTNSGNVDTISNVETFQFADQSIAAYTAVSANSFNALGYIASHGDLIAVFGTNTAAATKHYVEHGYDEGRTVSFNAQEYVAGYGDLIAIFGTNTTAATQHYIEHGYDEGRTVSFNAQDYVAGYGDLTAAFGTDTAAATQHYITNGYNEHRSANVLGYIASYDDLITTFGTNIAAAAQHYTDNGYNEERTISFNALGYVASNADLIAAFGTNTVAATQHFITLGHNEERATGFDASFYLAKYADLRNAFNANQDAATRHFITTGYAEQRSASNAGDDTLNGSLFADNLNAGTGNDTINGKAGNDILNGGEGINTLIGGAGADVFKFTNLTGLDTITDFQVVDDTIQLENAVFTSLITGVVDATSFVIGTAAVDANDYLIYNSGTGGLFYDVDGNGAGAAVQIALLGSSLALTNADFVVI